jgi:hypothetical protein
MTKEIKEKLKSIASTMQEVVPFIDGHVYVCTTGRIFIIDKKNNICKPTVFVSPSCLAIKTYPRKSIQDLAALGGLQQTVCDEDVNPEPFRYDLCASRPTALKIPCFYIIL